MEYSIGKFKRVYQRPDFYEVYGKTLVELIGEWEVYLMGVDVDKTLEIQIVSRYSRRSIFQKVCARAVAEKERLLQRTKESGDVEKTIDQFKLLLEIQPYSKRLKLLYLTYMVEKKTLDNIMPIDELLSDSEPYSDIWYAVTNLKIMALVQFHDEVQAMRLINELLEEKHPDDWHRRFLVLNNFLQEKRGFDYFHYSWGRTERLSWLYAQPSDDWIRYLTVLNWNELNHSSLVDSLELDSSLPNSMERHLNWTLLQAAYWNGDFEMFGVYLDLNTSHNLYSEYRNRYIWEQRY